MLQPTTFQRNSRVNAAGPGPGAGKKCPNGTTHEPSVIGLQPVHQVPGDGIPDTSALVVFYPPGTALLAPEIANALGQSIGSGRL